MRNHRRGQGKADLGNPGGKHGGLGVIVACGDSAESPQQPPHRLLCAARLACTPAHPAGITS